MDLDRSVDILIHKATKLCSLDNFDDNLINHFDICSDAEASKQAILKQAYTRGTTPRDKKYNEIIDVSLLLNIKDDYDFLEMVYITILNRPIEFFTLNQRLNELKNKTVTRDTILKSLENSDEGKDKQVLLIGLNEFTISDYREYSDIDFVKIAYLKILKRSADEHGLKNFVFDLKLNKITRNEIIRHIIDSQEASSKVIPNIIFDTEEKQIVNKTHGFSIKDNEVRQMLLSVIEKDYNDYIALESRYKDTKKDIIDLRKQIASLLKEIRHIRTIVG